MAPHSVELTVMLSAFILQHRDELIEDARLRIAQRKHPAATTTELESQVPTFLEQLVEALQAASVRGQVDHRDIDRSASVYGNALFEMGLTVGYVVHDYGDICQSITEMMMDNDAVITTRDSQTLNLCLASAIAGGVTAYIIRREGALAFDATERLGVLAHELRNQLRLHIGASAREECVMPVELRRREAAGVGVLSLMRSAQTLTRCRSVCSARSVFRS